MFIINYHKVCIYIYIYIIFNFTSQLLFIKKKIKKLKKSLVKTKKN